MLETNNQLRVEFIWFHDEHVCESYVYILIERDRKREIRDSLSLHKTASLNILTSCWEDLQNYIFCILFHPYTKSHALKCMQQYIWAHFFPLDDLKKISTLYYLKFFLSEILSKGFLFFFLLKIAILLTHLHLCKCI